MQDHTRIRAIPTKANRLQPNSLPPKQHNFKNFGGQMITILKNEENNYTDKKTGEIIIQSQILEFIRSETAFKIVNKTNKNITESELAKILIAKTKKKSESEKFFDSVKHVFESGKSSASHAVQDFIHTGYGALVITEKKARELIEQMIAKGKLSREKGEELFRKTKDNIQEQEKQLEQKTKNIIQKKMSDIGITSHEELEKKIRNGVEKGTAKLERELKNLRKQLEKLTKK